ncbi:MAG: CDP-diacylglycerol--glycerol-3-phosphate 3-phosphatidyltransferase [Clostridia bacterium]|nr:CDP-diacylglycerol--glycerol-3-phosphate 3-phosphatidyltransferase [Clostridia bacterium]
MNKNVPNILTMSRIACTPLIVLFFLLPIPYGIGIYIAFAIYVLGCLTDMVDGHIARKYNLISDFGKFMDQIADKFITTTAMILVMFANVTYGWLSIIMLLIVVLRDILIGGIRMVAANKNVVIAADIFGKVKSLFLDTANSFLLFYIAISCNLSGYFFIDVIKYSGLSLMIIGVLLSVLSCYNYSKNALKALNGKSVPSNISNSEVNLEDAEMMGEETYVDEIEEVSETEDTDDSEE